MKMKKVFFMAVCAIALFASCSDNVVAIDHSEVSDGTDSCAVSFGVALPDNSTRASKNATTNPFAAGDQIAVYGFQDASTLLFNNQLVKHVGERIWSYSPLKYWQKDSQYKFYAIYPYGVNHTFDTFVPSSAPYFTVADFVVNDTTEKQVDLMIAKQNTATPFNTVDFVFNHLLSNVNFYFCTAKDFDFTGIESFEILSFDVVNLFNKATYTQTAWDATTQMAVGAWDGLSGTYDFPKLVSTAENPVIVTSNTEKGNLGVDLLLMPQSLLDVVEIQVTYRINYADGSSSTFRPDPIKLNTIKGYQISDETKTLAAINMWEPNNLYNYTLVLNPAEKIVLWDSADHNGSTDEDEARVSSVIVDGEDAEGNDQYWVDIDGDKKGDYKIVWEDIDGDNFLEGGIDEDGDGHIDNVDGDKTITCDASDDKHLGPTDDRDLAANAGADATLIFKDTDVDTDIEHPKTQLEKPGDDNGDENSVGPDDPPYDPENPNDPDTNWHKIDWDGTNGDGDCVPTGAIVKDPTMEGEYMVDVDNDGIGEYRVVWEDIDGDGVLEGGVDRDGDGCIDDVDEDGNVITSGTSSDRLDQGPTDEITVNTGHKDVILIDEDRDGYAETQLERIPDETTSAAIQFTATVQKWQEQYEAEVEIDNNGTK